MRDIVGRKRMSFAVVAGLRPALCFTAFVISLAAGLTAFAQPTLLDPTFGTNGKVSSHVLSFNSWGNDAVLQPDGKIVVVGAGNNDLNFPMGYHAAAIRFNADGSLDATFDGDGRTSTILDPSKVSETRAVALQPDGKIVATGIYKTPDFQDASGFIIRYNANGSLDTSFDNDGIKLFPSVFNIPWDIAVQPDGKIIVAEHKDGFRISRFNSDGSPDLTFNSTGSVVIPNGGSVASEPVRLAVRPDGKIVLTGISLQLRVVQLNSDGALDSSFGTNGIASGVGGYALSLQSDGKILVVNRNTDFPANTRQEIKRLNSDGTLDGSFGSGGSTTVSFVNQDDSLANPSDLAVQLDGKILLGVGIRLTSSGSGFDFGLARLNSNGALDNSFGFNGRFVADIQGQDYGRALLLQPDGKIVLAGQSDGGFAVARYIPASLSLTCRPVADFNGDGKSDPGVFSSMFGLWQYQLIPGGAITSIRWGTAGDRIVPADYNGDCRTDYAVFRNGTWYIQTAVSGDEIYYQFGLASDIPLPADYDGDDLADPAVFRDGVWYVLGTRDGFSAVQFGIAGDKPVPGDYDRDGREDIAVYRDGVWYVKNSSGGVSIFEFGLSDDRPVIGDYDGDGKTDAAVFRPSTGTWYLLRSAQGFASLRWGISTDLPVPADYDGDGSTDVAVYRDGDWYILQSTAGYQLRTLIADPGDPIIQNVYVP
jgi:uncharacterized delta-60 repeat protein